MIEGRKEIRKKKERERRKRERVGKRAGAREGGKEERKKVRFAISQLFSCETGWQSIDNGKITKKATTG